MGYNRENLRRIRQQYDGKNLRAKEEAEKRAAALRLQIPELARIDGALSATGMKYLAATARYKGEALEEEIARLKEENKALQAERSKCLAAHGYPADYTEPKYECALCQDTGAYRMKMCRCMREKLVQAGYASSGIGQLMRTQSFDRFRLDVQRDGGIAAEYRAILELCKEYATNFNASEARNLLFMGGTGLGKTHLSTAIAKTVIENGYDVVYDTVSNILADYETERFDRSYRAAEDSGSLTKRYLDGELLIIDDLGSELTNQFTVSILFQLLNTRMNQGRSTIISTNLRFEEIRKRYTDRIASRLLGNYRPIVFRGDDVRKTLMLETPLWVEKEN